METKFCLEQTENGMKANISGTAEDLALLFGMLFIKNDQFLVIIKGAVDAFEEMEINMNKLKQDDKK